MPLNPHNAILELNRLINSDYSEIKLQANGGNSILLVCKPIEENLYIKELVQLDHNRFELIDLNKVLIEFVENNKDDIEFFLPNFKASLDQLFKNDNDANPDLFHLILDKINAAFQKEMVPLVINTGAIYATRFDMLALMESNLIMGAKLPAVFLYPAELDYNQQLQYLNTRIASEYRCKII